MIDNAAPPVTASAVPSGVAIQPLLTQSNPLKLQVVVPSVQVSSLEPAAFSVDIKFKLAPVGSAILVAKADTILSKLKVPIATLTVPGSLYTKL